MRIGYLSAAAVLVIATKATAQEASRPQLDGNPGLYFGADSYPPRALRAGEQGRVVAELSVDPTGRVTACTIATSSGSASLDETTCRIARGRLAFRPATDSAGKPVAGNYTLPVQWSLPGGASGTEGTIDVADPAAASRALDITMRVRINPDGTVAACTVEPPAISVPAAGPCSSYPVGRKVLPAITRGGRPVGATIVQRFSSVTEFDK